MGLPLRNPSSLNTLTSGSSAPGGASIASDSDPGLDSTAEPSCHQPLTFRNNKHPHRPGRINSPRRRSAEQSPSSSHTRPTARGRAHKLHHRRAARHQHRHHSYSHPGPADDAVDALDNWEWERATRPQQQQRQQHVPDAGTGRRRSRSASLSPRRRPPSLERQDAFRDERTVKRKRVSEEKDGLSTMQWERDERYAARVERDEEEEVAELYRLGLLYDDEHERGAGFSLDRIVREEPVYSLSVRRAKRGGREEEKREWAALSLGLEFSAFGEDEALAGWLLSRSAHGSGDGVGEDIWAPVIPSRETGHDNTGLTVIYELADDTVSALSADDFLESVSISELSYCEEEEDEGEDEMEWVLDGCNAMDDEVAASSPSAAAAAAVIDAADSDPWVVLDHDGS